MLVHKTTQRKAARLEGKGETSSLCMGVTIVAAFLEMCCPPFGDLFDLCQRNSSCLRHRFALGSAAPLRLHPSLKTRENGILDPALPPRTHTDIPTIFPATYGCKLVHMG